MINLTFCIKVFSVKCSLPTDPRKFSPLKVSITLYIILVLQLLNMIVQVLPAVVILTCSWVTQTTPRGQSPNLHTSRASWGRWRRMGSSQTHSRLESPNLWYGVGVEPLCSQTSNKGPSEKGTLCFEPLYTGHCLGSKNYHSL